MINFFSPSNSFNTSFTFEDGLLLDHKSGLLTSTDIACITAASSGGSKSSKYPLNKTNPTHNSFSVLIEPIAFPISVSSKSSKQPK